MDDLFWRLNTLPESQQAYIFAGIFGYIQSEAHKGNDFAIWLLSETEKKVERWEKRNDEKESKK